MKHGAHQTWEKEPGLIGQVLALLRLLIETFAQAWTEERAKVRNLKGCPTPDNWLAHWPALRDLEIRLHGLTLSGIEQLRATGVVDLLQLTRVADPTFAPQQPRTFEELRARYEAVTAFLADPIPLMRQAAERREASPLRLDAPHRSTSPTLRMAEATRRSLASTSPQDWGRWLATSSSRDGGVRTHARGPPSRLVAETHAF